MLNNKPSEPAVFTEKSDSGLKKKSEPLQPVQATSGMRQRIHPKFSDSTLCMHLFLINSKATPPAHTAEESV